MVRDFAVHVHQLAYATLQNFLSQMQLSTDREKAWCPRRREGLEGSRLCIPFFAMAVAMCDVAEVLRR